MLPKLLLALSLFTLVALSDRCKAYVLDGARIVNGHALVLSILPIMRSIAWLLLAIALGALFSLPALLVIPAWLILVKWLRCKGSKLQLWNRTEERPATPAVAPLKAELLDWREDPFWLYLSLGMSNFGLLERIYQDFIKLRVDSSVPTRIECAYRENPHDYYSMSKAVCEEYGDLGKKVLVAVSSCFSFKLGSQEKLKRQIELGITEGVWRRSDTGSFHCPHLHLDGRIFRLDTGLEHDGRLIYPHQEAGCICDWTAIIPGLDEAA